MRHAVVLGAVLLASPIVGQEEPLPPVTARVQPPPPVYVALAVEPVREEPRMTLEDAARANDYATFHALFEQTPSPAWAPLHELWTYSVNDPIGAFYGPELYARFADLYPDFAAYIADQKIVDDRGNVFYPTSETRAFLLRKAVEGRIVNPEPLPQLARREPRRTPGYGTTPEPEPSLAPAPRRRMRKADATGAPFDPAAGTPAPVAVASAPAPAPPVPAPEALAASEPPAIASAGVAAPAVVEPIETPAPAPSPVMAASVVPDLPAAKSDLAGRGILLIIIGLAGIGFLALILRTPREHVPEAPPASPAGDLGKAPH